jgi:hypothetical protein
MGKNAGHDRLDECSLLLPLQTTRKKQVSTRYLWTEGRVSMRDFRPKLNFVSITHRQENMCQLFSECDV